MRSLSMRNFLLALLALAVPVAAFPQDKKEARDLPAFLGPLPRPSISGNGTISCAPCHNPALGWADGLAKGVGINGTKLGRSSPTVANAAYYELQFWDGRAPSLQEQAKGPLESGAEMGGHRDRPVATLKGIPGYVRAFQEAFGSPDVTFDRFA